MGKDFTNFDLEIEKIESDHFDELYQPLKDSYTIFVDLNNKCNVVGNVSNNYPES
jgi:hypothetical protein